MQNKCTVNIFASLQVFIGLAPDLSDKAAFILFHPLSEYLDNKASSIIVCFHLSPFQWSDAVVVAVVVVVVVASIDVAEAAAAAVAKVPGEIGEKNLACFKSPKISSSMALFTF